MPLRLACSSLASSPAAATWSLFFFTDPAPPQLYALSLHDALPICRHHRAGVSDLDPQPVAGARQPHLRRAASVEHGVGGADRKSTRLNSSHVSISYAVFCLKKKSIQDAPGFR